MATKKVGSLKSLIALEIEKNKLNIDIAIPEELKEYMSKVRQMYYQIMYILQWPLLEEKKLFINLVNCPEMGKESIEILFPNLIKKHLSCLRRAGEFTDKEILFGTMLVYACADNNEPLAKLSIKAGVERRVLGIALINATISNSRSIIKILLDNNVEVDFKSNGSSTALGFAAQYGHKEIVKALINKAANLNAQNYKGYTALIRAIQNNHYEIAKILIKADADVNIQDEQGKKALDYALDLKFCPSEIIELLKQAES